MTDMTAAVQKPSYNGVAPTYTACTAADNFTAAPNSRYILHYKNGATATATGDFHAIDQTTTIPPGSGAVAGFADAILKPAGSMLASTELVAVIDNSTRFRDNTGKIQLVHGGTLTTLSVCIMGPFPA